MGVKSWFPNMFMAMIAGPRNARTGFHQATFKVPPKMTKWEVKEYLTKIYNVPVKKVMTQNFEGRRKKILGKRRIITYKRPNFKRAIVTLDMDSSRLAAGNDSAPHDSTDMKQLPASS